MNLRSFLAKQKKDVIFVGSFLIVLAFNITIGFLTGQTVLGATWKAISEVRPMEYLMFALFWYACAVYRPGDDWGTSFTVLNLSRSNNEK
jgi:hypothetical protein